MNLSLHMQTVTVNAAFLQEIKEDALDLRRRLEAVRQWCRSPVQIRTRHRKFLEDLEALRDQLALVFAIEEFYGYFQHPLSAAPRLAAKAARLRDQHEELFQSLCRLIERAENQPHAGDDEACAALAEDFQRFDVQLEKHEEDERELIIEALYDDLGVGD